MARLYSGSHDLLLKDERHSRQGQRDHARAAKVAVSIYLSETRQKRMSGLRACREHLFVKAYDLEALAVRSGLSLGDVYHCATSGRTIAWHVFNVHSFRSQVKLERVWLSFTYLLVIPSPSAGLLSILCWADKTCQHFLAFRVYTCRLHSVEVDDRAQNVQSTA